MPSSAAGAPARGPIVALVLLIVFSMLPIALVEIPAMVDYPNHLARMSVLARARTAAAHPLYEVAWAPNPNLAMDVLVPPLARLIGVELATKLFYLASQLLIVGGAMALAHVVRGRIVGAGLSACLFLYAMPLAFGFMNFAFALGLALLATAVWMRLADRPLALRLAVHAAAVAILFFAHLFALGLYGFAIGIVELWRVWEQRPPLRKAAVLVAGMGAPVVVLSGILVAGGGSVGGSGTEWHASSKIFWLSIQNGWSRELSALLGLAVVIPLYLGFRRGWLRFVGPGRWLAIAFALLFVAMPFRLLDTGFVDGRVLLAAILILPAFMSAQMPRERFAWAVPVGLGLLLIANLAFVGWVQAGYRSTYRAVIAAFDQMPRGSRLLIATADDAADPPADLMDYPMHHVGTLAAHYRDAFVPTLFTYPGKQPIRPRAEVAHLAPLEGGPYSMAMLKAHAAGSAPSPPMRYVANWTRDFDYLLLLRSDGADPMPERLERVAAGPRFALFRVRRDAPAATLR